MNNKKITFLACLAVFYLGGQPSADAKTLVIRDAQGVVPQNDAAVLPQSASQDPIDYEARDKIIATPELEGLVVQPEKTKCRAPQKVAPAHLEILRHDMISEKIMSWAQTHGYQIFWEGAEYRAQGDLLVAKNFEQTLADIKSALATHGINFTVTIYENCVVRFVESD
jgi:hypothetical protein